MFTDGITLPGTLQFTKDRHADDERQHRVLAVSVCRQASMPASVSCGRRRCRFGPHLGCYNNLSRRSCPAPPPALQATLKVPVHPRKTRRSGGRISLDARSAGAPADCYKVMLQSSSFLLGLRRWQRCGAGSLRPLHSSITGLFQSGNFT